MVLIALKIVCTNTNDRLLNADAVVQSFVFVGILITFSSVQLLIPTPKLHWFPMLMLKVVAVVLSLCLFRCVDFQRCHRSVKRDTNRNATSLTSDLGRQHPSSNKDSTPLALQWEQHSTIGNIQDASKHTTTHSVSSCHTQKTLRLHGCRCSTAPGATSNYACPC